MKFQLKTYRDPPVSRWKNLSQRPAESKEAIDDVVGRIFEKVSVQKDEALREFSRQFDRVEIDTIRIEVNEYNKAGTFLHDDLKSAIDLAYDNIRLFHQNQQLFAEKVETTSGVWCWRESRPIDKVGLYIPGGTAPLFSTVLMLGVPAQIAGCERTILCSPPNRDGKIHPAILYAAQKCGISEVYRVGGAQAIAAMTFGTESITAVYKIFGPGNQFVTAAKMRAFEYGVAIDLPAGPSEVLIYADETSEPQFVASDLLSQAEHGIDSQVVLVSNSEKVISQVSLEVEEQLQDLPRKDIAVLAMSHSFAVVIPSRKAAFDFINCYAPEHLIIASDHADDFVSDVRSAGSVFLGNLTPESAGDYASGTNHTLPTASFARSYSGVSLDSFVKKISFQKITKEGLKNIGPAVSIMARAEELEAHARAIDIRLKKYS